MDKQTEFTPKAGHPVSINFATDGNGQRVKGGALVTADTIEAVYAETDTVKNGKGETQKAYNVRLTSGDVVKVVKGDRAWLAVA